MELLRLIVIYLLPNSQALRVAFSAVHKGPRGKRIYQKLMMLQVRVSSTGLCLVKSSGYHSVLFAMVQVPAIIIWLSFILSKPSGSNVRKKN